MNIHEIFQLLSINAKAFLHDLKLIFSKKIQPYSQIDPHIKSLVETFNKLGLVTFASCQGHRFKPFHPYIAFADFISPDGECVTADLAYRLYLENFRDKQLFYWNWSIEPVFHITQDVDALCVNHPHFNKQDGQFSSDPSTMKFVVRFVLSAKPQRSGGFWRGFYARIFLRTSLDTDFKLLISYVQDLGAYPCSSAIEQLARKLE